MTNAQALDVALCWGWIDGIRKSFDDRSFLQRYTPRRARSIWSQINRDHVARLTAAGRMTPHGQRQVDAAKADGRWDAAYAPMRSASEATIPADLRAAIEANPRARKTFRTLGRQNLFALAFRTNNMKTPAGRAKKIAALVAMLARGETIVPERRAPLRCADPAPVGGVLAADAAPGFPHARPPGPGSDHRPVRDRAGAGPAAAFDLRDERPLRRFVGDARAGWPDDPLPVGGGVPDGMLASAPGRHRRRDGWR